MTGSVTCSAPGKLVLLGEYAVLFGHPAVVAAVDRRARVELRPTGGPAWELDAPGWAEGPVSFSLDRSGGVRWTDPNPATPSRWTLVERILEWLLASGTDPAQLSPASIELDTCAFFHDAGAGRTKLGLGSSAALTVALTTALARWAGAPLPELDSLLELHRRYQGGRGSGVDLAASLVGGVLEYRLAGNGAVAEPLALPATLSAVVVWTGRSASTAAFLARLDERLAVDNGAVESALAGLGRTSRTGVDHLRAGAVAAWLDDVDRHVDGLDALGRAAGLDILSDEHRRLRRLARTAGVRYKPSGAGGGDMGIAFTDDADAAAAFSAAADAAGFIVLEASLDAPGVDCDVVSS